MIKKIHTLSGCAVLRSLSMMLMVFACVASMQAQAPAGFHQQGKTHKADMVVNGHTMQAVHEDHQVIYALPGNVTLERPALAFHTYYRWYNYKTDLKDGNISGTGTTQNYGLFGFGNVRTNHNVTYDFPGTETQWIACDESAYTDYNNNSTPYKEPTLSNRVVYEVRPASVMADRVASEATGVDANGNVKWLEDYKMIAPTGQKILIGPEFPYLAVSIKADGAGTYFYNTVPNYYYHPAPGQTALMAGANAATSTKYIVNGVEQNNAPTNESLTYTNNVATYTKVETFSGRWLWREGTTDLAGSPVSGQFMEVSSDNATPKGDPKVYTLTYVAGTVTTTTTYTVTRTSKKKGGYNYGDPVPGSSTTSTSGSVAEYHIARFTVEYMNISAVGPSNQLSNPACLSGIDPEKPLASQNFNFGASDLSANSYYPTPFGLTESTFGFYYGEQNHRASGNSWEKPYYNEYALQNDGRGYSDDANPSVANHVGTGAATDPSSGYAVYVDGAQKPGTVFALDFNAALCPGAIMYFSAFVAVHPDVKTEAGATTLDFIVLGVNNDGTDGEVLTTFSTGKIYNLTGWQRILFPLEFESTTNYTKFRLRIINKAATNSGNDFFLDDIAVYLRPAPITPIQASTPNECLNEDSKLVLYSRIDYAQLTAGSELYYRWLYGNLHEDPAENQNMKTAYLGTDGSLNYGKFRIPSTFSNKSALEAAGYTVYEGNYNVTVSEGNSKNMTAFERFDFEAHLLQADDNSADSYGSRLVLIKEIANVDGSMLTPLEDGTNPDRYVAYVATPIKVNKGSLYTCVMGGSTAALEDKCASSDTVSISNGMRINSVALGGMVMGTKIQSCAHYSYDLNLVIEYIVFDSEKNKTIRKKSDYLAHWLFGTMQDVEDDYEANKNDGLYGTNIATLQTALEHYNNRELNPAALTDTERALITRLVQKGLLVLAETLDHDNPIYNVMPLSGETQLSYTAFPVEKLKSDAPDCSQPQCITLFFPKDSEDPENDSEQNVLMFVKNEDEFSYETKTMNIPAFVTSRPRRVRVPYTIEKNGERKRVASKDVSIVLTNPNNEYKLLSTSLFSTDDKSADAASRAALVECTYNGEGNITRTGNTVKFTNLDQLSEGKAYTFKVLYDLILPENISEEEKEKICGGVEEGEDGGLKHKGEAYITFIIVPELLYFDGDAAVAASWNDDFSWLYKKDGNVVSNVAPLKETNVILATGNHIFLDPVVITEQKKIQEPANDEKTNLVDHNALPYITYDIDYEAYTANNVYVPVGTALPGQQNVNAVGKWTFDMPITPGKWILTSMPIQGVVSGDMFMPIDGEDEKDVFKVAAINQTVGEHAVDRTGNPMYNSLYNQKAIQKSPMPGYDVDITSSVWTLATNSLNTKFGAGYGWALGYNGTATDKTIRLPKVNTEYHFFSADHNWHAMTQSVDRTNVGKPAFEVNAAGVMTVHLTQNAESNIFLLGNPTFAYIDLAALATSNGITAFYKSGLEDGHYTLTSAKPEANGEWAKSLKPFSGMLAPMQAVFIKKAAAGKELDVVITKDMLYGADGKNESNYKDAPASAPLRAAARADEKVIYIAAEAMDFTATASVVESEDASNEAAAEDVELFMLDKTKTPFSIFTLAGNTALAINQINDAEIVPFALYSEKEVESVEVTFGGNDSYLGEWDLVDQQSDLRESLYNGMTITLMMPTTGARYYLEHARHYLPGTATGLDQAETSVKAYTEAGQLTVFSDNDMMDFRLYDAAGRLIMSEKNAGRMLTAGLNAGAYMIRTNGEVLKVIVK